MRNRLWLLLIVSSLFIPITLIAQTNDSLAENDIFIRGDIDATTPFVAVPFSIAEANTLVTLDMRAVSGDLNPYLYLLDQTDTIIAENDDRDGGTRDSFIEFPGLDTGDYTVIATRRGVSDGATSGSFELLASRQRGDDGDALQFDVSPEALIAAGYPEQEPRQPASWTILAYYGGDTNLEDGILVDLNEFEIAGGSDEQVNIIAMIDRHPEYSQASGNWVGARLYEVTGDADQVTEAELTIDSTLLADFGTVDTGTGETFAQFLAWALRAYPAEHYAIALASHGAGWRGIIEDDTDQQTLLTLPELNAAFTSAKEIAGVEYFDLLVNDACLMSSIEYHKAMSDYFNYSLASPEIVVNPALDMTLFTQIIKADPDLDLATLGQELVDVYITRDAVQGAQSVAVYLTSALTDLRAFDAVVDSLENFAEIIAERPAIYSAVVGQARADSYTYTSFARGDELIDLGSFVQRIIVNTQDAQVQRAASDVLDALEGALVYANAGDLAARQISTYQNIYFPPDSQSFELAYLADGGLPAWGRMLRNYYNAVTPRVWSTGEATVAFHAPIAPRVRIISRFPDGDISSATALAIEAEVIGRNIASGDIIYDYSLDDGRVVRYTTERLFIETTDEEGRLLRLNPWQPGANTRVIRWDGTLPVLTDGANANYESFTITDNVLSLEGRYRQPGGETWSDVVITFDRETGAVERVINQSSETDSLGVINIEPGSAFQTYLSEVTPDGSVVQSLGNVYIWDADGPTWSWQPSPSGEYNVGLVMTAFGGTTAYAFERITVDNDDADAALRAELSLFFGYTVNVPKAWPTLAYDSAIDAFRTGNETGDENVTVYYDCCTDDPPVNDVENVVQRIASKYGLDVETDRRLVTLVNDALALEFDYQYQTAGETVLGRGLASFVADPPFDTAIVVSAETTNGSEALDALYDTIRRDARIFDLTSIPSDPNWTSLSVGNASYPIPIAWIADAQPDDIWQWSGEDGDPNAANRVGVATLELTDDLADHLDALFETHVAARYEITDQARRTYNAENNAWQAITYTATAGEGAAIQGRLYVTAEADALYAVWFEASDDEDVADVIVGSMEPVVDGFVIEIPEEE